MARSSVSEDEKYGHIIHVEGNTFDLSTEHGRFAARSFAYSIMADKPDLARRILNDPRVGREG